MSFPTPRAASVARGASSPRKRLFLSTDTTDLRFGEEYTVCSMSTRKKDRYDADQKELFRFEKDPRCVGLPFQETREDPRERRLRELDLATTAGMRRICSRASSTSYPRLPSRRNRSRGGRSGGAARGCSAHNRSPSSIPSITKTPRPGSPYAETGTDTPVPSEIERRGFYYIPMLTATVAP